MIFLGTDELENTEMGMISIIAKNIPYNYISIKHIGIIENGIEDSTSDKIKSWTPAFENYTFKEKDGGTEVTVDQDIEEQYSLMFNELWPKALQKLKELVEK